MRAFPASSASSGDGNGNGLLKSGARIWRSEGVGVSTYRLMEYAESDDTGIAGRATCGAGVSAGAGAGAEIGTVGGAVGDAAGALCGRSAGRLAGGGLWDGGTSKSDSTLLHRIALISTHL